MGRKNKSTEELIISALESLAQAQQQIKGDVQRHEKILEVQGLQIEALEQKVVELRNAAIVSDIRNGMASKDVATKYSLSPGRISQIKNM
jgi:DNA-binding NarL/FixJ family response regulator